MSGQDQPGGPDWWLASDGKWYPPQGPGVPPPAPPGASEGGFFSRLFDLSMTTYITPSIAKVLFVLGIIGASIYALVILVAFGSAGDGGIVLGIILAPVVWIFGVIWARVWVELVVVFFQIERNTRKQ